MRLCCWREDLEKWKLLISGSFIGVEDCDFDELWVALPAPAGGRGSVVTVSTGAVAVRLGWCWFRLLLDVLVYYGEEERWSLWACGVFDSVGKVRETRIMVLVVAGGYGVSARGGDGAWAVIKVEGTVDLSEEEG
ncbi:hypothetical protein POTOM_014363 [Populus tomentosa]|uniref:Uncharacterized protein n=1 Tax=Populus tomentosa TaxID=118781 RepID=A0A8X8A7R0_POPTO|nr:hypothetical protein POTOM_014363 [Populus tomentosa]